MTEDKPKKKRGRKAIDVDKIYKVSVKDLIDALPKHIQPSGAAQNRYNSRRRQAGIIERPIEFTDQTAMMIEALKARYGVLIPVAIRIAIETAYRRLYMDPDTCEVVLGLADEIGVTPTRIVRSAVTLMVNEVAKGNTVPIAPVHEMDYERSKV